MSVRTIASSLPLGNFATGTYTGDGAATQAIIGVGFQPIFVFIYMQVESHGQHPGMKTDQQATEAKVWDGATPQWGYLNDHIITLDADGFTVGDGTGTFNGYNIADTVYGYVCFG